MRTLPTRWPDILAGLVAVAMAVSVSAGNIGLGLLAAAALVRTFAGGKGARVSLPRPILAALTAVILCNLLATLLAEPGSAHWAKLVEEWWIKLALIVVPLVLAGKGRSAERVAVVTLAAGLAAGGYGVVQHFLGWDYVRDRELFRTGPYYLIVGFSGHHLSLGGQLLLYLTMTISWLAHQAGRRGRSAYPAALMTLVFALALVWTFARSCYLGLLVAGIVLVATLPARRRGLGVLILAVVVAAGMAVSPIRARVTETFTNSTEMGRVNLWRSSVEGMKAKPVLGWGPGNFDRMMSRHEVPGFYEVRGHAHNDFLMQGVNAGLLGLAAFLWLQVEISRHLWRGWRRLGGWVLPGLLASQAGILAAGFFQVYQTDDEPEMLLYFLLGLGLTVILDRENGKGAGPSAAP